MNKRDLIEAVALRKNINKKAATEIVEVVLDTIECGLLDDQVVSIFNFGKFEVVDRAGRKGRNPSTGEIIKIEPTKGLTFKPGKLLKERVRALAQLS